MKIRIVMMVALMALVVGAGCVSGEKQTYKEYDANGKVKREYEHKDFGKPWHQPAMRLPDERVATPYVPPQSANCAPQYNYGSAQYGSPAQPTRKVWIYHQGTPPAGTTNLVGVIDPVTGKVVDVRSGVPLIP